MKCEALTKAGKQCKFKATKVVDGKNYCGNHAEWLKDQPVESAPQSPEARSDFSPTEHSLGLAREIVLLVMRSHGATDVRVIAYMLDGMMANVLSSKY